jgi:hypothetical protein
MRAVAISEYGGSPGVTELPKPKATYAEDVAVTEEAPPAPVPAALDPVVAAALPTSHPPLTDVRTLDPETAGPGPRRGMDSCPAVNVRP